MKKYIFTESQIKKIIDNQINEQTTEERILINAGSEEFLNMKKIQGKDLTEKIKKYHNTTNQAEKENIHEWLMFYINRDYREDRLDPNAYVMLNDEMNK